MAKTKPNSIQIVDYKIEKEYQDNSLVRSLLYTERLYNFMIHQNLSLLPTKIINVILSAVKQEQQVFIKDKNDITNTKQLSFEDVFGFWSENSRALFTISFKSIKLNKSIKNIELYKAFIALSNLNWEIYTDESTNTSELVPFIEGVKWNSSKEHKERYIQFRMHKKTMESLLDMSRFLKLESNFVMDLKSSKTLSFIFWVSKHIPNGGTTIAVKKFCKQMNITYTYNSKVEEYLNRIRAEMNSGSFHFGMNYSIPKDGKLLKIQIFNKKESIGKVENIDNLQDLQIRRAMYHIVKTRRLNEEQSKYVEAKYNKIGYKNLSLIIKRRISQKLIGKDYIDELDKLINCK